MYTASFLLAALLDRHFKATRYLKVVVEETGSLSTYILVTGICTLPL